MTRTGNLQPIAFVDDGLGNSSYLVDLGAGRALVVDPARHPGGYLAEAERRGLDIAFAVETHLHADFVSGARELGALGATLLVPGAAGHGFAVRGVADGEEVDLGGLTLRGLATPGHTPEHLSYLLLDGATPLALFSGGSLLVDAVARTDLIAPDQTEALARELWRSLHERILSLPDDLPVYPTHGAGSFCSAPAGAARTTTVGRERAANPLLAAPDEDAFVKQLLDGLGTYPPYFLRLRDVNRAGPRLYGPATPLLPLLSAGDVARLQRGGALVVDVRPVDAFARGHIPGVGVDRPPTAVRHLARLGCGRRHASSRSSSMLIKTAPSSSAKPATSATRRSSASSTAASPRGSQRATRSTRPRSRRHPSRAGTCSTSAKRASTPPATCLERSMSSSGRSTRAAPPAGAVSLMCGHGERAMTAASLLAARRAPRHDGADRRS